MSDKIKEDVLRINTTASRRRAEEGVGREKGRERGLEKEWGRKIREMKGRHCRSSGQFMG